SRLPPRMQSSKPNLVVLVMLFIVGISTLVHFSPNARSVVVVGLFGGSSRGLALFGFIFALTGHELSASGRPAGGGGVSSFWLASVWVLASSHDPRLTKKYSGNRPTAVHSNSHSQKPEEALMARGGGKAPKQVTWVICLVLYLVALLAHFGVVKVSGNVADWAWIIGFGLLLAAVQIRGL